MKFRIGDLVRHRNPMHRLEIIGLSKDRKTATVISGRTGKIHRYKTKFLTLECRYLPPGVWTNFLGKRMVVRGKK